jgi:hypothetical protein
LNGKQYQRVTGNFSLNPNSPKIFAGYRLVGPNNGGNGADGSGRTAGGGGPGGGTNELKSNPWFNPSFLANFNAIMGELFNLNSKSRFLEAKLEIKGGQIELAIAKDKSEATKSATDARVAAKQIEAFAAFAQAAISFGSMAQTANNSVKARKECVAQRDKDVGTREKSIVDCKRENTTLEAKNITSKSTIDNKREENKRLRAEIDQSNDQPAVATGRAAL